MRTVHFGLRVSDLERSLAFYAAVGYQVLAGDSMTETVAALARRGVPAEEPTSPDGSDDFWTD